MNMPYANHDIEKAKGCIRLLKACLFVRMTLASVWVIITVSVSPSPNFLYLDI